MRFLLACILGITLAAPAALAVEPLPADDPHIKTLGSQNASEQREAMDHLVKTGASAVVPLLNVMDNNQRTAGKMAYETLSKLVYQAADTDQGAGVCGELIRELNQKHAADTRNAICRLLSFIGDDQAVNVLYRAMSDPEVGEMARWALARIPTRRATQALLGALQTTEEPQKIAVLGTLGYRGDTTAVRFLIAFVRSCRNVYIKPTLEALAKLPSKEQLELMVNAVKTGQPGAIPAALCYAETLANADMKQEANQVLQTLEQASSLTVPDLCRLIHVQGILGGPKNANKVLASLATSNPHIHGAVYNACSIMAGHLSTVAIAKKMAACDPPAKVRLLECLGQRRKWMKDDAAKLIIEAARDSDESVRLAAIAAIEQAGITSGLDALLNAIEGPAGTTQDAAEQAINHIPGENVSSQLAEAVRKASPATKAKLILALGHRGGKVFPTIKEAARDSDASVRAAAFKAMGMLKTQAGFDILLEAFKGEPGPDREAAERAMRQFEGVNVTERLLEAYKAAETSQKPSLLRVIGYRKHPDVPALLSTEVDHPDVAIQTAAIEGLGRQADPKIAPALLAVARHGPEKVTEAAITGYLRAAHRQEGNNKEAAGDMFVEALKLAVTDDQRSDALEGIIRCVPATRVDVLPVITPWMANRNLHAKAADAVARFSVKLPESRKEEAVSLLREVVKISSDRGTVSKAVEHLRRLGVDVDPAHDAGFITRWWLLGPLPNPRNAMWDKAYPPEQNVDLNTPLKVGNDSLAWNKYHSVDLQGLVDLDKAVSGLDDIGAYAYAEITVDKDQEILLKIGSDDSIVVWINGEKAHAWTGSRGVKVDEDKANARLKAGTNKVLVKILDAVNAWGFCLRVCSPDGKPLAFEQRID